MTRTPGDCPGTSTGEVLQTMDSTRSVTGSSPGRSSVIVPCRRCGSSKNWRTTWRMYRACVERLPRSRCCSTRPTTPASKPKPGAEGEPARRHAPRPRCRACPRPGPGRPCARGPSRSASSRAPVASTASLGSPRARAKTLVEPPGTTARPGRSLRIGAVVQQAVDDLVDRAVAAEGHDQIDVVALRGLPAQVARVPAVLRGHRLQLHLTGQRVDQHVTRARTGGGCCRIDHEKCTHGASVPTGWYRRPGRG